MKKNSILILAVLFLTTGFAQFASTPLSWETPELAYSTNWSIGNHKFTTRDMNGDDLPDYVVAMETGVLFGSTGNRYWKVYLNNGNGFNATPLNWATPDSANCIDCPSSDYRCALLDMNGDNKPDYVVAMEGGILFGTTGDRYWKVYLNSGAGFVSEPIYWKTPELANRISWRFDNDYKCSTQDMNGDNMPDYIVSMETGDLFGNTGNRYWKVYVNNGNGFDSIPLHWPTPESAYDIDSPLSGSISCATKDMNGDYKPDYVVLMESGVLFGTPGNRYWKVYMNNGNGFDTIPLNWKTPENASIMDWSMDDFRCATVDFNGDDKPDYAIIMENAYLFGSAGNHYWEIYINNGSGFDEVPRNWDTPDSAFFAVSTTGTHRCATLDMNGDDKPDYAVTIQTGVLFGDTGNRYWKVYLNNTTMVKVDEAGESKFITVYPNPMQNMFNIKLPESELNNLFCLSIHDNTGKLVLERVLTNTENLNFDLTTYQAGVYNLTIKSNTSIYRNQFIKK